MNRLVERKFVIRRLYTHLLLLFLLTSLVRPAIGQPVSPANSSDHSLCKTVKSDFTPLFREFTHWSPQKTAGLAAVALMDMALIYRVDGPLDRELARPGTPGWYKPLKPLVRIGEWYDRAGPTNLFLLTSAGLLGGGWMSENPKMVDTGRKMIEAVAVTSLTTWIAKGAFGRKRPYTGANPDDFNLFKFSGDNDYRSFPSGHTSHAFAMMTILARQYPRWWVKYPAYIFGVSAALQRIDHREHWLSDVLTGGLLGYAVGRAFTPASGQTARLSVIPAGNRLVCSFRF